MRIIDREAFLKLPAGTVYAKWGQAGDIPAHQDMTHGEVAVKGDTVAGVDWVEYDLLPWPEDCQDSGQWADVMSEAIKGTPTAPLDIGEGCSRDGYFDKDQLFAVYDRVEVERIVALFARSLETAY